MADFVVMSAASSGAGSLREAIDMVNVHADATNTIIFDPSLAGQIITLAADLPQITANVVIDGSGAPGLTVSGDGQYRVFWANSGTIEIANLTIEDGLARGGDAGGGSAGGNGGGGAGLGGGLFVDQGADVMLRGVSFAGNAAQGGDSGASGMHASGSGGGGMDADGGAPLPGPGDEGGSGGGPNGGVGGTGVGGDGQDGGEFSGGGGGRHALSGGGVPGGQGGHGGFGGGGGGGGAFSGGSAAHGSGGDGGFGGGGGARGGQVGAVDGVGGYAGGDAGISSGGGGAGLGGAVFVRDGGSITLEDVSFGGNSVAGGAGFENGSAEGAGLFLMGGGGLSYSINAGQTVTVASSVESNAPMTLNKTGAGTLILAAHNDFSAFVVHEGVLQAEASRLGGDVGFVNPSAVLNFAQSTDATYAGDVTGATGTVVKSGVGVLTLSGTIGSHDVNVLQGTLRVAGDINEQATVFGGARLEGTGSVGSVIVQSGGTLAPGASPGVLNTGDLTFAAGATLEIELGGTGAGQFDRLNVAGTVDLGDAFLDIVLLGGFTPVAGDSFILIDNDGTADAVTGTFAGFDDDVAVAIGGLNYTVDYQGGDGNDVVLTVSAIPPPAPRPIPTVGGPGDDLAILNGAGTRYSAGDGADMVMADGGNDFVHGNVGDDSLYGGTGNDIVHGGQGLDVLYGDDGDDVLFGDKGDDFVHSGRGNDVIEGGEGSDALAGGQGDDVLRGGDGADVLTGDKGNDTLAGGPGPDVFRFAAGGGADVVVDFNAAEGDRAQVAGGYTLSQAGADVVIDLGSGDTLTLQNVQLSGLPAGWILS